MAYCFNCGSQVYQGERFCTACRMPLDWIADSRMAPPPPTRRARERICDKCRGTKLVPCEHCYAPLIGASLGWITGAGGFRERCPICHGEKLIPCPQCSRRWRHSVLLLTAQMRKVLISVFALAIMAIVVIGLFDFDLMLEIWVKVLIGVLFVGVIVAAVKRFSG